MASTFSRFHLERRGAENINLVASLLVHAQYHGYWRDLGKQFAESGSTRTLIPAQGGQQSGDCGQHVMAG